MLTSHDSTVERIRVIPFFIVVVSETVRFRILEIGFDSVAVKTTADAVNALLNNAGNEMAGAEATHAFNVFANAFA